MPNETECENILKQMMVSKIIGNSHHSEDVQNIHGDQSYINRRKNCLKVISHMRNRGCIRELLYLTQVTLEAQATSEGQHFYRSFFLPPSPLW